MSEQAVKISKGSKKTLGALAVIAIILIVGVNCFFILEEGESALVQRFGRIEAVHMRAVSDEVRAQLRAGESNPRISEGTGLKFKLPFIENVIKYPSKLILYESPPTEVITRDKHRLYFDNSAQWRIDNPLRFYTSFNNIESAKTRIDDRLFAAMRDSVGRQDSYDLISDRDQTGMMLVEMANTINRDLVEDGISIVDIRIKRTDLPEETYASIYNRMITERQQVAERYRSEGEQELLEIRSATDREVRIITSRAQREAEEIRGEGDSEAARIYNEAYNRDPSFFEFYNLLETYRKTVGRGSTMVVPLDSPFAKYLLGITPEAAPAAVVPQPTPVE
jgi:membrane protease subunit HflC